MTADAETLRGARAELIAAARRSSGWAAPFPPVVGSAHEASVLVLFGKLDSIPARTDELTVAGDLDVLLQRRAATLSSHPGQVSFPGGRREEQDADAVATALREAQEETGLDPAGVEVLATLSELPLAASNHRVTPVLGWWRSPSRVVAVDHAETVEVFRVPVAQLLDPSIRFTSTITRMGRTWKGPAFDVDGTIVWGFTAMVLDGLFDAAGWTRPWDRSVERPIEL
ncbi:putative Nudix hydrolase NudL [Microbacterium hydrocarbonoxydans]|jgi:8-oxo-dGTP pyrophosphatase MutT (NUDIX family)|uniref:Putative Nudix hydrolase NudL n=1 Tax=Microbacterium hydrocarbonoxydans TaxID=273678 RepID=A0A0M2HP92_9MICO|nr:CoA pyrophosphatase [Microbacterium hydrocarbonoxydans]KJL48526.1 putative Nudix hydrolase NudL [Microbacterium hydrocarbonoxydans]